jgi:hypothetical protein
MSPTPPPQPPSAPRPGAGAPRRGAGAGGGGGGSPAGSAPSPPPAMPRQQPQRQQQQQRQPLMQEEAKEESPPPPRGAYTLPQGGGYDAAGGEEDEVRSHDTAACWLIRHSWEPTTMLSVVICVYRPQGGRIECESCGRRFAPEAYEKHSRICAKVCCQEFEQLAVACLCWQLPAAKAGTDVLDRFCPVTCPCCCW